MRVYAAELICSTGVLGFHTFKLALCIYNKLRSHSEILSWWAFDVTFPGSSSLRSNRSGLNLSNGGLRKPKLTLKVNGLGIKIKVKTFASQVLSIHTCKISRKRGSYFFDQRDTLTDSHCFQSNTVERNINEVSAVLGRPVFSVFTSHVIKTIQ